MLTSASAIFQQFKLSLVEGGWLSKDALHIYTGMGIYLVIRLLWRGRRGAVIGWLVVLAVALAGEALDLVGEGMIGVVQPDAEHWHDVWNTMFWPTILMLFDGWLGRVSQVAEPAPNAGSDESAERGGEQP